MTTPIGYATLQIIPSLDGVSEQIDKQLGGKLRTSGKAGGKALAKGVGEGLKDLEREVESASKAYGKLRDRAADALDKITVEEKKLARARAGGKEDQIAAAEARLNKARRDSVRATREAEDGHKSLTSAQKRLGDGADDTGRRMGGLGSSLRNMGGIAGGAALAGIAALTTGVVVAGRELYQLGSDLDEISDNLQVKTGLTGAALDKLRGSVEKLGTTNVPSSFAEIGDVAAEVTRNLHVTGPELEALTSRLANLDRMGQSVDIRSLSKAFRGFGVDAKDQVPALNSLYEASTKSGLSIDDMLSAMLKSGPALRQFGFDFGEAAALAGTFEEAGLDGEKAMAALNKAFAYFSAEGIPAEQGLRDIVARIRELGDTPEAAELATKVFGAKGGAGFLEAIQNGTLDLQALQSSLRTTGLDINQVSDDTADWSERWQDLKNELAVATQPLANDIFDTVNTKLDEFSTWVTENEDKVIDFFVDMGEGAISAAEVTLTALAGVVDTLHLFDTLVMKGFSWLPGYDDAAAKEFNDSLGDLSEKLNAAADSSLFNDLRTGLRDVADEAKTAADNTDALDVGLGKIAGRTIDLKTTVNGQQTDLGSWFGPSAGPGSTPGQNPLDALVPGGGGQGAGLNLQIAAAAQSGGKYGLPAGTDIRQGAEGFPDWVYQVADAFGLQASTYSGHQEDRGQGNQGIDWWGKPEDQQRFAEFLAANAANIPGLEDVIWQNPNTGEKVGVNQGRIVGVPGSADPGYFRDDFGDHTDHVHTTQSAPIPLPVSSTPTAMSTSTSGSSLWDEIAQAESGGRWNDDNSGGHSTSSGAPRGGLQITDGTWRAFGGTEFAPTAAEATKDEQITVAQRIAFTGYRGTPPQGLAAWEVITQGKTPNVTTSTPQSAFLSSSSSPTGLPGSNVPTALNNAFGPGYEPGIGTPGYDEYGEPGYFEVDPRDVKGVQDRIADQMERIRESDEAARQAQVAIDELEVDADQAEKDAAIERKRKADYDANVARRELGDLELDLQEAQKGTFSPAREAPKSSTRGGSDASGFSMPSTLSGFGSAIGEFAGGQIGSFLDVFGVGDSPGWLKGISEFVGGIGVTDAQGNQIFDGGNMFGGASPVAASPSMGGVPPGTVAHGTGAGQPPGPTYIINARDTEDAFIRAQRLEREKAAAKLARF